MEEHEVLEAIDLKSKELPACIAAEEAKPTQQPKPTCSSPSNHKNSAAKDKKRTSATSALSSNKYKANLLVYEALSH